MTLAARCSSIPHQELEAVDVLQGDAGATGHGAERVIGHMHRQFGLDADALVEAAQQGAAAGQVDAGLVDVGAELGRRGFERAQDGLLVLADALVERLRHLAVGHGDRFGDAHQTCQKME